jgi:acyl-CoA reductase-like NAD-dependent aldehyde dehydrogenase
MDMSRPELPFESWHVFIDGRWRPAAGDQMLPLIDPSTGELLAEIARGTAPDIDAAVRAAQGARDGDWGRLSAVERGRVLARMAGRRAGRYVGAAGSDGRRQAPRSGEG